MIGGLSKSTSLAALLAVAGLALTGMSAQAADLGAGGNCCADLEERIAELEATTARKGNRKVSLTVSGLVNESILFWDDGVESNAYVTTNETQRSRFRFLGSAKIDNKWSAGYLLEIGVRGNKENNLSQNVSSSGKNLDVRQSAWYLQNSDLGKVWVGQTGTAGDGITEINLANIGHFSNPQVVGDTLGSFNLRNANGVLGATPNQLANYGGASTGNPGEGFRFNVVKYETPTLAGFIGSAAYGEDKLWDIALRYAGEMGGFKLAAGIAYEKNNDGTSNPRNCIRSQGGTVLGTGNVSCDAVGLSVSLMHVPTGLFVTGAYGEKTDDNRQAFVANLAALPNANTAAGVGSNARTRDRDEFYLIQGGIEQSFFPIGKSTLFGEYYDGRFGAQGNGSPAGASAQNGTFTTGLISFGNGVGTVSATEIEAWGVGFNQNVAAAALDMYVSYRNYSFDVRDTKGVAANINDIQTVIMGARIQF